MPSEHPHLRLDESAFAGHGIFLEMSSMKGQAPRLVPATVQNLAAGVVTLEISRPGNPQDWQDLPERTFTLHLMPGDSAEPLTIPGKVTWARYPDEAGDSSLCLGLELAGLVPEPAPQERTESASSDIQDLWAHWDQLHRSPVPLFSDDRTYLLALGLLSQGMALQLLGHQLVGLAAASLGLLAISGKALSALAQKIGERS